MSSITLWAFGAEMRARTRRSELTCGYWLPGWLADEGLKSSTAGARTGGAGLAGAWGGCARMGDAVTATASATLLMRTFTRPFIATSCRLPAFASQRAPGRRTCASREPQL